MPFILREIEVETPSTFSKKTRTITRYVTPENFDPAEHELAEPTSQQVLETWSEELPEEYDPVEGYVGEQHLPMTDEEFQEGSWREAVEEVESTDSLGRLQHLLELETSREPDPRASVLEALEGRGIAVPDLEEEDEGDEDGE